MKRSLRSTPAALVLAAVLPNGETRQFWDAHKGALNARGICEHSADNWSFCAEFHDGLLVQDTVSPTEAYAAWDNCKEGRPVKTGRPSHQSPRGTPGAFSLFFQERPQLLMLRAVPEEGKLLSVFEVV